MIEACLGGTFDTNATCKDRRGAKPERAQRQQFKDSPKNSILPLPTSVSFFSYIDWRLLKASTAAEATLTDVGASRVGRSSSTKTVQAGCLTPGSASTASSSSGVLARWYLKGFLGPKKSPVLAKFQTGTVL